MKKSKHFRKDVILARVIAAAVLILLIVLICFGVSLLTKAPGTDENSQNTESTQDKLPENQETQEQNTEEQIPEDTEVIEDTQNQAGETEEQIPEEDEKVYVETTTQVKLRKEPNTNCATLDRIDGGTKLEVLETLEGWYKVIYDGKEGYVSATYARIVEE